MTDVFAGLESTGGTRVKWDTVGMKVEGWYRGCRMVQGKDSQYKVHLFRDRDGKTGAFAGTVILNDEFIDVEVETPFSIEYLGTLDGNKYKSYDVKLPKRREPSTDDLSL